MSTRTVAGIIGGCLLAIGGCLLIVAGCHRQPENQNPTPEPAATAEVTPAPSGKPGRMELVITPQEPLSRDSLRFTTHVRNNTDKTYRWDKLWVAALFWEVEDLDRKGWIDYVSRREFKRESSLPGESAEVYRSRFVGLLPGRTMTSEVNLAIPHRLFHIGRDVYGDEDSAAVVRHYGVEVMSRYDIPTTTKSIEIGLVYTPGYPDRQIMRRPELGPFHRPPYTRDGETRPFWTLYGFWPTEGGLCPSGLESNRVRIRFDGQNGSVIRND